MLKEHYLYQALSLMLGNRVKGALPAAMLLCAVRPKPVHELMLLAYQAALLDMTEEEYKKRVLVLNKFNLILNIFCTMINIATIYN
jgi:hypothetical protein